MMTRMKPTTMPIDGEDAGEDQRAQLRPNPREELGEGVVGDAVAHVGGQHHQHALDPEVADDLHRQRQQGDRSDPSSPVASSMSADTAPRARKTTPATTMKRTKKRV